MRMTWKQQCETEYLKYIYIYIYIYISCACKQRRKSFGVQGVLRPIDFGPVVSRLIWTPPDFYISACKAVGLVKSNKVTHKMCQITIRG